MDVITKKGIFDMKAKNKISVLISAAFGVVFLVALIVVCFFVPNVAMDMIAIPDRVGFRNEITKLGTVFIISDIYLMIAVGVLATIILFLLLKVVSEGEVFSKKATKLLSSVSFCCFFEGLLSLLLVFYFQLVFCVTLAACFLGFCLLIVKNVIEEATRIKEENDFTV